VRTVLGAALLVCAAITAAPTGAPAAPVANERTYVDERGEDVAAPDITSVVVSNDDTGLITFRLLTANRKRLTQDMRVRVWITARGAQYFLLADPYKPQPVKAALYGCEQRASGLVCAPNLVPAHSLRFRYARGAHFTFDLSALGLEPIAGTRSSIRFYAQVYSGLRLSQSGKFDFSDVHIDRAPSRHPRTWAYIARFGSS
jgi:hypothetical protein